MFGRLMRAAHRHGGTDAGLGMIMVIGLATVMTVFVTVLISISTNSLDATVRHKNFDAALSSAETGIDETLGRLQYAYTLDGAAQYYTPSTGITGVDTSPTCNAPAIQAVLTTFASAGAERDWAHQQIVQLANKYPSCIQHAASGDFVVIKPQAPSSGGVGNGQTIYSEGWSPHYGSQHVETRMIKAVYLFEPYAPSNAILTQGNLQIDSSTTVATVPNVSSCLAQVHSNGTATIQTGNPTIWGQVSSTQPGSGTYKVPPSSAGCNTGGVTQTPAQNVPSITAREVYSENATKYPSNWYDMCPDGTVRAPSSSGPCDPNAHIYATLAKGQSYNGFAFQGIGGNAADPLAAYWTAVGVGNNGVASGTYYFDAGDIAPGKGLGAKPTAQATIIASALNDDQFSSGNCPKIGGNIEWDLDYLQAPAVTNLFMFADADLHTDSHFQAGSSANGTVVSGEFIAGDQVNMQTSSNGAYGSVIAEDQCPASPGEVDEVKNPAVYFDPNGQAPFTSIIDTALWLEYVNP